MLQYIDWTVCFLHWPERWSLWEDSARPPGSQNMWYCILPPPSVSQPVFMDSLLYTGWHIKPMGHHGLWDSPVWNNIFIFSPHLKPMFLRGQGLVQKQFSDCHDSLLWVSATLCSSMTKWALSKYCYFLCCDVSTLSTETSSWYLINVMEVIMLAQHLISFSQC